MALKNLEGVEQEITECEFITNKDSIEEILNRGIAATAAGDHGAINIWKDDDGFLRCEAMKLCNSIDKKIFSEIEHVEGWAEYWLGKIG